MCASPHHCSLRGVSAGSLSTICATMIVEGQGFGPGFGFLWRGFRLKAAASPAPAASAQAGREAAIPRAAIAPTEADAGLIQPLAAPGAAPSPIPFRRLRPLRSMT